MAPIEPEADEAPLVEQARRDPQAFGELYHRYVDRVYRYCYRRLGAHGEAEDFTAETFRRALQAMPGYRWTGAPFGAWLFRIAGNLIYDRRRALAPTICLSTEGRAAASLPDPDPTPLDLFLQKEQRSEVWAAVGRLSVLQQRVLVLRFAQGLDNRQVARIIKRSRPATKQLVYRSLKALRELLAASEGGEARGR
ncbi:MAG: sigma-70 family RNA polymerase sigma factor [Chloroflexi bacterium]|nr:sigma-70 family RNA polymerase sigma factor [Chloroflexota bacterium]